VTVDEFARLRWRATREEPVLRPPAGSPILADPTFLLPHETPDARWHLFAHSIFGVHHVTSADGERWSPPRLAVRHAMRPYLYREGATYHLVYERYPAFRLALSWLRLRWRSWIERRTSTDLVHWSAATVVLRPTLPWHCTPGSGDAVGNPSLVRTVEGYSLYYSAALIHVPDCGFNEPLYIGVARSRTLEGPWELRPEPVLSPRTEDPRCNLGAGALRVLRLDDGFVGLQNGIAFDAATRRSRSAVSLVVSDDGICWRYAHAEPIVAPTSGWRGRFVYACDVRHDPATRRWYLYFNARDRAPMLAGREAIGFVVADGYGWC
jgi:hypothetical protein